MQKTDQAPAVPAGDPETTPQRPATPESPGFAEVFEDEAAVAGWRLAFAAKQHLSVTRDAEVGGAPTYALRCRCGAVLLTAPALPFARFEALAGAITHPPLRPSLAFPRRPWRWWPGRAPPAAEALDAWCDILSQNVRAAAREPPTRDLAAALDALGDILPPPPTLLRAPDPPTRPAETPPRPATDDALVAHDASVDRRLDGVAAKLRALRRGRTGRKPGRRPGRRALASLRDAPEVAPAAGLPPPPARPPAARSPNNFSERGRAPVLAASATETLLHMPPRAAPAFGDASAPVHTPPRPALAASATETLLHVAAAADEPTTRGARSHRRGDSLTQFLEQEPAVAEEAAVEPAVCRGPLSPREPALAEERAVEPAAVGGRAAPSPAKLVASITETLFHRPAAPPALGALPMAALERELSRRRSAGLSDGGGSSDSMSDDASFVHGDDDLDSNGTLSPIPSRSATPVFYGAAVEAGRTPRSTTPTLYESVLDPEATPTHRFRPVEPSPSARLLDFLASPFQ